MAKDDVISSVRIDTSGPHARLEVFNRGAHAGTLVVLGGDAAVVAQRLLGETTSRGADHDLRVYGLDAWEEGYDGAGD